jgi:hypothetical protein
VLTDSFHMSGALGSSNIEKVLSENRTCATSEVKGECSDHCATEAPLRFFAVGLQRVVSLTKLKLFKLA